MMNESTTNLKMSVIGIGNAGNQVAMAAAAKGHNVFAINTSTKDLDDRVLHQSIKSYYFGDGRGSGKNRDNAMALLKSRGKEGIQDLFTNEHFAACVTPADIVVVVFSTGGGTGSGIGPMVASLISKAYPHKVVIPYGILPKDSESITAQVNTIACVDDIVALNTPYMLADLNYYGDMPQEKAFKAIADYMVEVMNVIRGDYLKMTTNGMADERDVLTVIAEPGYMTVHFVNNMSQRDIEQTSLQGHIIQQIQNSPTVRIQRDGLLQFMLLISNVNDSIVDVMKSGDYSELIDFVGEPKATFANYAVDNSTADCQVISVMSGLTIPMDRFTIARAKIKANKEKFEQRSAFNLGGDRKDFEGITKNTTTTNLVMSSGGDDKKAELGFLDDLF